jgi:Spy/CpxP family protein refolding chaperone
MKSFFVSAAATLGLMLAACSGQTAEGNLADEAKLTSAVSAEGINAKAKDNQGERGDKHHARKPHGGPDMLVFAALREPINLTAEQKATIEGLRPKGPPAPDKARTTQLAAAIRSGNVSALPAMPGPEARFAESAKALATLHATLTKEQRAALVDAVSKRHAEHGPKEGAPPRGEREMRPHHEGGPMGHMLEGLDLTQAQKDAIKSKLDAQRPAPPTDEQRDAMKKQHETMRTEMQARLKTFANDTFDANAFVKPPGNAPQMKAHVDPLSVIVPVLTQAQREKLAARIEQGPPPRRAH